MSSRVVARTVMLLCAAGVLFWLAPASDVHAQKKTNPDKAAEKAAKEQEKAAEKAQKEAMKLAQAQHKKAIEAAQKMLREEYKGKESEALKTAYVLMAAANGDYDGHRAKAMKHVENAFEGLDANIMKNGTLQQRIKTAQEENAAAKAKILGKNASALHEVQALSDAQMFKGAAIVHVINQAAVFKAQAGVHGHLQKALVEAETALKIR
jgi:hypothetical protein